MQSKSDAQLLREYAESGSEPAFTELVTRHTDLVYSAALRQVSSSDLACDVAQNVFTSLARGARTLAGKLNLDASLAGWLCRCTRNLALNLRRDDFRRHTRERQAMETLHPSPETAPDWGRLCPLLDEAISGLNEADHDALVLRFFKNQDLRSVGLAMGVSDDTAQKRVSRALEKLREYLTHHGITTTGAALAMAISANAVQAAPVGLAATISTAAILAGTVVQTSTVIAAAKAIAMTTIQKTLITVTIAAAVGAGIYEARQASTLRTQVQTLQQQQAPLAEQIRELQRERDDATNRLAMSQQANAQLKQNTAELLKLRGEVARLHKATAAPSETQNDPRASLVESWLAREDKLKKSIEQYPDKAIPELQLLSEQQWLDAAMNAKFDTDKAIRQTLADLRHTAENNFASLAQPALSKYMQANNGQFPTDLSQLQPYFETPIGDAILSRWEILPQSALPNQKMGSDWVITEKAPVDPEFDNRWAIGSSGYGNTSYQSPDVSAAIATMDPAMKAYAAANNGKEPTDPSQILPYLTTPEQQAAYQTLSKKRVPVNSASQ
jgi:RNA polymerase sigma factor (sigma-70 family)